MSDSDLDIAYIANLARLNLSEDEQRKFGEQLSKVLQHVDKLRELDVDGIEPTAHTAPVFDVTRDDVARPGLSREDALANAPKRTDDQFLVTKVVE